MDRRKQVEMRRRSCTLLLLVVPAEAMICRGNERLNLSMVQGLLHICMLSPHVITLCCYYAYSFYMDP
jgi:hypothetical protein